MIEITLWFLMTLNVGTQADFSYSPPVAKDVCFAMKSLAKDAGKIAECYQTTQYLRNNDAIRSGTEKVTK